MGTKKLLLLAVVVAALGAGYYFWQSQPAPLPPPVAEVPPPPALPAEPPVPPEPVERYPLTVAEPTEKAEPVDVDRGEARYAKALGALFGKKILSGYFYPERMIRRFVATIDNLPRQEAPAAMMPVKPVGGAFLVERDESGLRIAPANDQRYARYLAIMSGVDAKRLVDTYVGLYPLFQQAYRELGYPTGFFNDRLVEAIDNLLATPDVAPPLALVQPKVLYKYADPALEGRSAGQKIMLRLGADNRTKAKQVLTAIRAELLSRSPPRPQGTTDHLKANENRY